MHAEHKISHDASNHTVNHGRRAEIYEELKRILDHPTFKTSNRCIVLLSFVVKQNLTNAESEIKERTLGIEVFGREANYDAGADPIVRRVANEVRKRLAQYYQEDPDGHTVKIHLPRGGYHPEYEFLAETSQKAAPEPKPESAFSAPAQSPQPQASSSPLRRIFLRRRTLALAALGVIVVAGIWLWVSSAFHSSLDKLWRPMLDAKGKVLVCLPDDSKLRYYQPQGGAQGSPRDFPAVTLFRDSAVGNSITSLLSRLGKQSELRASSDLKFADLQHNSVVLIGGMNNPWVSALLSNLRYSVQFNVATRDRWIQDAQSPLKRDWKIDGALGSAPPEEDYAVVTRVFNEETGQWVLALSGLEGYATQAAGELATDSKLAEIIPRRLRGSGNFQIVLRTTIIGEDPGPVQIVAFYSW